MDPLRFVVIVLTVLGVALPAWSQGGASAPVGCGVGSDRLPVRCYNFEGHTFAVAELDLRTMKLFAERHGMGASYEEIDAELRARGAGPWLITNAGIYDTARRPLGLLISDGRVIRRLNTAASSRGNFSWNSAVFQTLANDTAEIIAAREWKAHADIVSATQSGPMLLSAGKPNTQFAKKSTFRYTRTAIGVTAGDRHVVNIVVSQDEVTLFELTRFMKQVLECTEALHLDGSLSAFFLPETRKYLFRDPGRAVVTFLAIFEK